MDLKLFVDTMVFLHFRPLDELDLASRTQADVITLVVPRITLRELDKHKSTHSSRKIRDRARRVLAGLEAAIGGTEPLKGGIAIKYFPIHPKEQLERLHLNSDWADDMLVASVVAYVEESGCKDVAVLSQDTGLRLTCRHHEIKTFQLDDRVALPEDVNDAERENRELHQQVQRLQNLMPRLEVAFADTDNPPNVAKFSLFPYPAIDESKVADALAEIREAYPKKALPNALPLDNPIAQSLNNAMRSFAQFDMNSITSEQIARYNSELDRYFERMETYLREQYKVREPTCRTISFSLEVRNTGTAPAEDVDVSLHFPNGFRLMSDGDLPKALRPPAPPKVPLSRAEELSRNLSFSIPMISRLPELPRMARESPFRIEEAHSYNVTDHFARVKHGIPAKIPTMYIEFPTLDEAKSFNCTYELRPANLATPSHGELHFVIEVNAE